MSAVAEHPNAPDVAPAPRVSRATRQTIANAALPPPPPHDDDCEASILGGIIIRNEVLAELPELEIDDFYQLKHRVVFEAMRNLQAKGKPIDVVMLEAEIDRAGRLDAVGGIAFITDLAMNVPTVDNVRHYAEIVRQHSRTRQVILALGSALHRAQNWPHEPSELVSEMLGELGRLEDLSKPPPKRLKLIGVAQAHADMMRELANAPIFPTPFEAMNDALGFGGLIGTQVYTVAAGTGRGKTTWVSHVGAHNAEYGIPVLIVSYEMKPGYFVARKAAGAIGRHSNDIIRGRVGVDEVLGAMPYHELMFFMHRPSLAELREAVDHLKKKFGRAPLVVVDYMQKLADQIARGMPHPDLRMATSQASETLCDIAEKSGAAVIAVSAIGRGKGKVLSNPRKLPPYELVEVAKESGAVEYDGAALIVLSLADEMSGDERVATMTVAKARFGVECHIDARYDGRRGIWSSLLRYEPPLKIETPPDDGKLAAAIVAALRQHGPQKNKTALVKIAEVNRSAGLSEVDEMRKRGTIVVDSKGFFMLPEQLVASIAQGRLEPLIRAAESDSEP